MTSRRAAALSRVPGVLLGAGILALAVSAMADGLPSAAVGTWLAGEGALVLLGITLVSPWRHVVDGPGWWLPLVGLVGGSAGALLLVAPAIMWAGIHGAWSATDGTLLATAVIVVVAQIPTLLWMRRCAKRD